MMMNSRSSLIVAFASLPAILAQSANSTANSTTTTSPAAAGSAANASTSAEPAATPAADTPVGATPFTPIPATASQCGTAQQNFNQCINKVGKDISSCTDNTCLCQTYANIAACYNGCKELEDQGKQYQAQSSQYCQTAGVKPNTTATLTPNTTTPTSTTPNSNTSPIPNNPNSSSSNNTANFSAAGAKSSASFNGPTVGVLGGLAVMASALCL